MARVTVAERAEHTLAFGMHRIAACADHSLPTYRGEP